MRVQFDGQIFMAQQRGGISRYFAEIIWHFINDPDLDVDPVLTFSKSHNLHLSELASVPTFEFGSSKYLRSLAFIQEGLTSRKKFNVDAVHHTFYSNLYKTSFYPSVSTLYDMIPELFPSRRNPHLEKKKYMLESDLVLSISKTSLQDMERFYGFRPKHSAVTYLGVSDVFSPKLEPLAKFPPHYLLFVGQRDGYKRGDWAIKALSRIQNKELHLVFVGPGSETQKEKQLVEELGLDEQVSFCTLSENDLARAYSNALALVFPNLYEGFGFPPLEAMKSGIPVIAARNEINNEIYGDHLIYFESQEMDDLVEKLKEVISSQLNHRDLIRNEKFASTFTWHRCATQTAKAYKSLLEGEIS